MSNYSAMRLITDNIRRKLACRGICLLSGIGRLAQIEGLAAKQRKSSVSCEPEMLWLNCYGYDTERDF